MSRNLDTISGRQILDLLDRMNEAGLTRIVVTHDPNVARRADRVIALVNGPRGETAGVGGGDRGGGLCAD